jgi:hypothetical protein
LKPDLLEPEPVRGEGREPGNDDKRHGESAHYPEQRPPDRSWQGRKLGWPGSLEW